MTADQAIKILEEEKSWESNDRIIDAFIMAISALEELKEYKLKEFQCHLEREEGVAIGYSRALEEFEPITGYYYKGQQLYVKKGATNGEINKKR